MASGAPDWWTRSKTDIIAQALASLDVDIIAQTLGNLAVDIAAQSLANLDININQQDLAQVAVDIAASTIGDLAIDINAQTIGNIAIDIAAQTLGTVAVRPFYTEDLSARGLETILDGETKSIRVINGQGIIKGGIISYTTAGADPIKAYIKIEIDTIEIISIDVNSLRNSGIFTSNCFPVYLTCFDLWTPYFTIGFSPGCTFETKYELKFYNNTGANLDIYWYLFWSLTP